MRDILFKAKRIDNGEWVEGLLWKKKHNTSKIFITCFPDKDDNEEVYVVDSNTICQYTGLTDDDGKKIWENDVLHIKTRPKVRQQTEFLTTVDWDAYCAGFLIEDDKEGGAVGLDAIAESGIYEIIENLGSIFDHPELLEEQALKQMGE